jgi:hypothetical protein
MAGGCNYGVSDMCRQYRYEGKGSNHACCSAILDVFKAHRDRNKHGLTVEQQHAALTALGTELGVVWSDGELAAE